MRFAGGINQDQHESRQPEGTYRDARNVILDDERGALKTEAGTIDIVGITTNYAVVGSTLMSDGRTAILSRYVAPFTYNLTVSQPSPGVNDILYLTINGVGYATPDNGSISATIDDWIADQGGELAVLDSPITAARTATNVLTLYCSSALTIVDGSTGFSFSQVAIGETISSQIGVFNGTSYNLILSDTGFSSSNKLEFGPFCEMTSRINHKDEYLIYWTDDVNPPRYLNIDLETGVERGLDTFTLFPTVEKHPYFQFNGLVAGGSLGTGSYHIALAYVNADGTQTGWIFVSHPIYVNDETNESFPDTYDGAENDYPTNRAISFSLTEVDENYSHIRIALIDGSDVRVMPDRVISLDNGVMTTTVTGNEAFTDGTLEEIVIPTAYYTKAKTLRQVDDRLYLGNVETLDKEFDYQKYANNISVEAVTDVFNVTGGLGYKDNEFSFTNKSFRRDEVYALYMSWVLKDGSETKAFHIPGRGSLGTNAGLSSGYVQFQTAAPTSISAASVIMTAKQDWIASVPSVHTIVVSGATALGVDVVDATYNVPIAAGMTGADVINEYISSMIDTAGITFKNNIQFANDPDDDYQMIITNRTGNNEDWNGVTFSVTASPKDGYTSNAYATTIALAGGEDDEGQPFTTSTIDFYGQTVNHVVSGGESKATIASNLVTALTGNVTINADYDIAVDGGDSSKVNIVAKVTGTPPEQFNSPLILDYRDVPKPFSVTAFGVGGGNEFYAANETELLTDLAADPANEPYIGRITQAFGIPGGAYDTAKLFHFSGAADAETGMGYWENANEDYPSTEDWDIWEVVAGSGQDTGRTLQGQKVRHHRFPDNYSNTVFDGTDTDPNARALGFKLTNVQIPNDLAAEVIGFKVYYAKRTDNNKTILDQGEFIYAGLDISTPASEFWFSQNKASDPAVTNAYDGNVGAVHPFNLLRNYPNINLGNLDYIKSQANIDDSLIDSSRVGLGSYIPAAQPRVRSVAAKTYIAEGTVQTDLSGGGFTWPYYQNNPGVSKILLELDSDLHGAGESSVLTVSGGSGVLSVSIEGIDYTEAFDTDADTTAANWVATHAATLAALTPSITATDTGVAEITLASSSDILLSDTGTGAMGFTISTGHDSQSNHLVNLCSFKLDVYNSFTEQSLVWTGYFQATVAAENEPFDSTTAWHAANETSEIYGGDTYISKYTFKEHMDEGSSVLTTYSHDIVCESDDNIGFRHEGPLEWEIYYPKSSRALFLNPGTYPDGGDQYDVDNPYYYNEEYNDLQDWKVSFPYDGTDPDPTSYPTRVIRSGASTGTNQDHFRRFLVDDYLDFPRQRGELVHLANMGSVIIAHMKRGLYRTRGKEELNFSDIRAFIGSGDIFSVQPTEIGSTEIGLGGLQDQRAAVVTANGYYWIDKLAKRVYMISGEGIRDVTGGLTNWMEDNLDSLGILHLVEDMAEERLIITGYGGATEETLSLDLATNTWTSFHSYSPHWYLPSSNNLHSITGSTIYQHHTGDYGNFYGVEYDSFIEFIENDPPGKQKQVAYLLMETVADDNGVEDITTTFSSYRITNSYQDTGTVPVDTTVSFSSAQGNTRRHRGFWRMNVGRDTLNIPSTSELRRYGTTQAYQKRLIDKWHKVRLTMDNSANLLLYIFHAQLISRQSKR